MDHAAPAARVLLRNPGSSYQAGGQAAWGGYPAAALDAAPAFTYLDIPRMLRDGRVQFGLRILRSPFQQVQFRVRATSPAAAAFATTTLRRFWRLGVPRLLHNYFCWGYAPAVFAYGPVGRRIGLVGVTCPDPRDAAVYVRDRGRQAAALAGFDLPAGGAWGGRTFVGPPHGLWFAGHGEFGPYYDRPRLAGAFAAFLEKNGRGGALHSRRLWYRKNAYSGGTVYHPPGDITLADGERMAGVDYARQILEYEENGGIKTWPNTRDALGNREWEYEPPESRSDVAGVLDYPKELDAEIDVGLGIPPEVVEAAEAGGGWSGRMIPAMAFFGTADELAGLVVGQFVAACLRPLVRANFGPRAGVAVEAVPLYETLLKGGKAADPQAPPTPGVGGAPAAPDDPAATGGGARIPYRGPHGGEGYQTAPGGPVHYGKAADLAWTLAGRTKHGVNKWVDDANPDADVRYQAAAPGRRAKAKAVTRRAYDAVATDVPAAVAGRLKATRRGRAVLAAYHAVHTPMMAMMKSSQAVALEAARARGKSEAGVQALGHVLFWADFAGGYAVAPVAAAAGAAVGGPAGGVAGLHVGAFMPSASLIYIAQSGARNPVKTWRAARQVAKAAFAKVPPGGRPVHMGWAADGADGADWTGRIADAFYAAPDPDWFGACFAAAVVETRDVGRALAFAAAQAAAGRPPARADLSRADAGDAAAAPDPTLLLQDAMLFAAQDAAERGEDPADVLAKLAALSRDAVAGALKAADLAWTLAGRTKGGNNKWVDDANPAAKPRYQPNRPGEAADRRKTSAAGARAILNKMVPGSHGEATHADVQELAGHLKHLTVAELRTARQRLGAAFGGAKNRDAMAFALIAHVVNLKPADERPEEEPTPVPATPPEPPPPPASAPPAPAAAAPPPGTPAAKSGRGNPKAAAVKVQSLAAGVKDGTTRPGDATGQLAGLDTLTAAELVAAAGAVGVGTWGREPADIAADIRAKVLAPAVKASRTLANITADLKGRPAAPAPQPATQESGNEPDDGPAGRRDGGAAAGDGRPVAGAPGGPGPGGPNPDGPGDAQPAGQKPARRVPAELGQVNRRLDRFRKHFRDRGEHQVADWLDTLAGHVNTVGVDHALESLGPDAGRGDGGATTYEGAWDKDAFDDHDPGRHMAAFCESYLNRAGITLSHQVDPADAPDRLVSSASPDFGGSTEGPAGSYLPKDPTLKNKLEESKALPGLEASEDINVIAGGPVTHLTPDVMTKMDDRYGKGQWIIKAYGDDAAAGYGIFFPQRAEQIRRDSQGTIWSAGSELSRYGFSLRRDKADTVVGLEHTNGDRYDFGSKRYKDTIQGDARHWGDRAAEAAANERGAELPGGGKEFMAQPAFKAVGVSDADRAAGRTIAPGEGRCHIITRNGKAELVPNATWIKGEPLPVVFESDDTRAMAQAAVDAINALPESERQGQVYAPDILKAESGYKVVEANPSNNTGTSGYLGNNPLVIDSYVSHLTGRAPAHVQFIRKLLSTRK